MTVAEFMQKTEQYRKLNEKLQLEMAAAQSEFVKRISRLMQSN